MTADPSQTPPRGLFARLFGLFNSVTFGIWMLVILFVYSTIGSAGAFYPTSANIFSADTPTLFNTSWWCTSFTWASP